MLAAHSGNPTSPSRSLSLHCRQSTAANKTEPRGLFPAHMISMKNILIDSAIKRGKSKQRSRGTFVWGASNLLPRASLSRECRLFIRDVWLVSEPERVHRKENIWEWCAFNWNTSPLETGGGGLMGKGHVNAPAYLSPFSVGWRPTVYLSRTKGYYTWMHCVYHH